MVEVPLLPRGWVLNEIRCYISHFGSIIVIHCYLVWLHHGTAYGISRIPRHHEVPLPLQDHLVLAVAPDSKAERLQVALRRGITYPPMPIVG